MQRANFDPRGRIAINPKAFFDKETKTMRKLQDASARHLNLIGGEWVPPTTGTFAPNRNPANIDDVVGEYPVSGKEDAAAAVNAAKAASAEWASMPAPARG